MAGDLTLALYISPELGRVRGLVLLGYPMAHNHTHAPILNRFGQEGLPQVC